jgi:cysteine desulfurase
MKNPIYFDNAATTQMDPRVAEAMAPFMHEQFGNPSSIHSFGRKTRAAIETARRTVARLLNAEPGEIFFTSGGTEADNMALRCAVRDLGVKNIITSPIEHHAICHTADELAQIRGVNVHFVALQKDGHVDLNDLQRLLDEHEDVLVTLMHANNELGNRLDLYKVSEMCQQAGALFHSDTVQTMSHYRFDLQDLKLDMLSASAHKFHGPKGIGFLFKRSSTEFKPMITGGGQERNMRAGTENLLGMIGLAKAMELAHEDMDGHHRHVQEIKSYAIDRLRGEIPGVSFNGDVSEDALYTVLNIQFPEDGRSEMLLYNLDIEGIAASGGSACSSGSNVGSHVIRAVYPDAAGAAIRFSFSRFNKKAEVDIAVDAVKRIMRLEAVGANKD